MTTFANELTDRPDASAVDRMGVDERTSALKRTVGGSIDYDFYLRRAHRLRAEAAYGFLAAIGQALRNRFARHGQHRSRAGSGMAHPA